MKLFRTPLAMAACVLALAACGESSGDDKASAGGGSLGAAKAVVIDYLGATFSGDTRACELETESYSATANEGVGAKDCAERVESIKALLTDGEPLFDVEKSIVKVTEDGDGALAKVTHETEDLDGTYRLVLVDGDWKINGEGASASGDAAADEAGADEAADASGFTEPREVPEADAVAMASAFCAVKVGTTRAAVERILGEPSAEGTDDDGQAEIDWFYNQDSYTVWFDDKDAVASFSSSTPRDDAPCPS